MASIMRREERGYADDLVTRLRDRVVQTDPASWALTLFRLADRPQTQVLCRVDAWGCTRRARRLCTPSRRSAGRLLTESQVERESRVREKLQAEGYGLRRREDGFYNVTDHGMLLAPNGWRVAVAEMNDRGGELGDPYPLTLGWIEHWIRGGMGKSPL